MVYSAFSGMHTKGPFLMGLTTKEFNTMNWTSKVKKTIVGKRGVIKTPSVTLEWEGIEATSPLLTSRIRELSNILIDTYVPMELEFARQHPEAVPSEFFLKPLAELFKAPKVNWQAAEEQLKGVLQQFFNKTDFAQFAQSEDLCLLVVAKSQGIAHGMIQFLITPEYEYGTIKAGFYAAQKGIEHELMGSVFKVLPETNRIFLHTRSTNEASLALYRSWGFTQFEGPLPYWTDMEYLVQTKTDQLR
jgi:hypothetical protein